MVVWGNCLLNQDIRFTNRCHGEKITKTDSGGNSPPFFLQRIYDGGAAGMIGIFNLWWLFLREYFWILAQSQLVVITF